MNTINSSIQINCWRTTHYLDESQGEETGRYKAFMATMMICIMMPTFQTYSMFGMTSHGITNQVVTTTKKWMFAHTSSGRDQYATSTVIFIFCALI
jgi:hypothetical protein